MRFGSVMLSVSGKGTLTNLEPSQEPGYDTCRKNTRYKQNVNQVDAGSTVCFIGNGIVAAITLTEPMPYTSLSDALAFRLTIWQG